jgi:DNA-binding NarL/FixJ family response regulator
VLSGSVERLDALGLSNFAAESARAAARVCASNGDSRRASHWLRRSEELLTAAGIPTVDPVTRLAELHLSTREREVALLAARGVANRDIADRLCISVRTVGNHLSSVYAKLGIGGRAELAELIGTSLGTSGSFPTS